MFLIAFWSPKQSKNEGDLCIVQGKPSWSSNSWRNQALELHNPLQKPNKDARRKGTEEINHTTISQVVESNLRDFRKLWNRKRKGIAVGQRANELQDNFATCKMDNFNLRNFRKLHLNLRNPPIIWDICSSTPFDIYLQIFVYKSLFSPCNPPMTSFPGWEVSRRGE